MMMIKKLSNLKKKDYRKRCCRKLSEYRENTTRADKREREREKKAPDNIVVFR